MWLFFSECLGVDPCFSLPVTSNVPAAQLGLGLAGITCLTVSLIPKITIFFNTTKSYKTSVMFLLCLFFRCEISICNCVVFI